MPHTFALLGVVATDREKESIVMALPKISRMSGYAKFASATDAKNRDEMMFHGMHGSEDLQQSHTVRIISLRPNKCNNEQKGKSPHNRGLLR